MFNMNKFKISYLSMPNLWIFGFDYNKILMMDPYSQKAYYGHGFIFSIFRKAIVIHFYRETTYEQKYLPEDLFAEADKGPTYNA